MTEHNVSPADTGPTDVSVTVHLGAQLVRFVRLGDWGDGQATSKISPYVAVRVGDCLAIMTGHPDHLDRLASCVGDAARALRAIQQPDSTPAGPSNGAAS